MTPSQAPRRVWLVVDGDLGPALVAAFAPLAVRPAAGTTVIEGIATDVDAVLARISDLGLTLLALETDRPRCDPPGPRPS